MCGEVASGQTCCYCFACITRLFCCNWARLQSSTITNSSFENVSRKINHLGAALAICIPQLSKGQQIFLQIVANRVKQEITEDINGMHGSSEPLRWMLHGGAGRGKSKALSIVVQFFELLGYVKDKHFEIGAFQGKMARLSGGSTLHQLSAMKLFGNDAWKERSNFLFLQLHEPLVCLIT